MIHGDGLTDADLRKLVDEMEVKGLGLVTYDLFNDMVSYNFKGQTYRIDMVDADIKQVRGVPFVRHSV